MRREITRDLRFGWMSRKIYLQCLQVNLTFGRITRRSNLTSDSENIFNMCTEIG